MAAATAAVSSRRTHVKSRSVLIASANSDFRRRLAGVLTDLRWDVREAQGGAEAWGEAMDDLPQALIVDTWLPDLDVDEFLREFRTSFPNVGIITNGTGPGYEGGEGPFQGEILYALRNVQDTDTAAWNTAPVLMDSLTQGYSGAGSRGVVLISQQSGADRSRSSGESASIAPCVCPGVRPRPGDQTGHDRIPELVGNAACILDVSRRIHRVAPRSTAVLIEGPTGSGKEVVAKALHRLSTRNRKPFAAINCAAIPEALLEAELFGHARGAFTGAVQRRVGRIEAADGGTLFLDEIGEMPLALQAKLLRFVESGELQRVGENETVKVDVRLIAATHRQLGRQIQAGEFRTDLYYRLAVFLIRTPALAEHMEDLPALVDHFLERMGHVAPVKGIDESAMVKLREHLWPGNVRELEHVLERAAILAGDDPVLTSAEIDFGAELN